MVCENFAPKLENEYFKKRRVAKSMLLEAVLLLAQRGAHEIRSLIISGQDEVLKDMPLNTRGTAAEFCEVLAEASPLGVLKLVK